VDDRQHGVLGAALRSALSRRVAPARAGHPRGHGPDRPARAARRLPRRRAPAPAVGRRLRGARGAHRGVLLLPPRPVGLDLDARRGREGSTSTRAACSAAAPPWSVVSPGVSTLAAVPPGLREAHQPDGSATTPRPTTSPIRARTAPRALRTRTRSPLAIPRAA